MDEVDTLPLPRPDDEDENTLATDERSQAQVTFDVDYEGKAVIMWIGGIPITFPEAQASSVRHAFGQCLTALHNYRRDQETADKDRIKHRRYSGSVNSGRRHHRAARGG